MKLKAISCQHVSRRQFLAAAVACVGAGPFGAATAKAESRIAASESQRCATCAFWDGRRTLSIDGNWIVAEGTGVCTNPRSPVHGRQTPPELGSLVWRKWEKIG